MASLMLELLRRADMTPIPTEAEAAAAIASNKIFSLGSMFSQVVVDTFMAGVMTVQVYTYFMYQSNDRTWTRIVVIAASVVNAAITVYIWYFIQYLFVQNFGLFSPFFQTGKLAWFPLLDSINSGLIQTFFAYRAYLLCGRKIVIPVIIGALILTSFGAAVAVRVIFARLNSEIEAAKVKVPELIWLSSIMSADILITGCIMYGLIRSKTGWAHTDKTITRLIGITLESQFPPTIIAIVFMAEFVNQPNSLFGATLQGIQSKFYGMGLMYGLNSRITFLQQYVGDSERSNHVQVYGLSSRSAAPKTQIQVDVETEVIVQGTRQSPWGTNFNGESKPRDLESTSDVTGAEVALDYASQAWLASPERH